MPRKYILLLSQHMKLLDNTFDETHLFVKRKFSEMMEGLSKNALFMEKLASLQPTT